MNKNRLLATLLLGCTPPRGELERKNERPAPAYLAPAASDPKLDGAKPDVGEPVAQEQERPAPFVVDPLLSTSIGSVTDGSLEGGIALPLVGPGFSFSLAKDPERRYGTVEVVAALRKAAAAVEAILPGGQLVVGDLSRPQGGDIPGHASHRAGRDVDLYFFLLGADDKPFPGKPIPIEPNGRGTDYHDLADGDDDVPVRIDLARTWGFMEALVTDDQAHVNRIFLAEHLRTMLLDHAKKIGAPRAARERFGHVTCQPRFPHDDHAHVRFYCSTDDIPLGCQDRKPVYPWHQAHLAQAGAKVRISRGSRGTGKRLSTPNQAAEAARKTQGPFHDDVTAFLKRRKAWSKRPHPGRKYCP